MYCTKCGNEVPEGYKFCPKCGAKLVVPVAESQARQESSPAPAVSQGKVGSKPAAKAEAVQPQSETAAPVQPQVGQQLPPSLTLAKRARKRQSGLASLLL